MAYFSNSTEGAVLDEQCCDCRIGMDNPCPVAFVQGYYNYMQVKKGNKALRGCLSMLVREDGSCAMKETIDEYIPDRRQPTIKGLGRDYAWLEVLKQEDAFGYDSPIDLACGCYDG